MERKLTTIFACDAFEFSKHMELDEKKTLNALNKRKDLINSKINNNYGVVFGGAGDSIIAEFNSPLKAVEAAIDIQKCIKEINKKNDYLEFRIGINIGDVIIDNNNLYGDAVNIASRLESEAKPSGICVSKTIFEMIDRKINVSFKKLDKLKLKNISQPIEAYKIIESIGINRFNNESSLPRHKINNVKQGSLAVFLFKNLSNDKTQDYFCEGLCEDLIYLLSQFKKIFVMSSDASFAYNTQNKSNKDIRNELGVEYIIKGSVRKINKNIRINVQLISTENLLTLWSKNYNNFSQDIFEVQDEISKEIVATIVGRVEANTINKLKEKPTENMAAYELVLKGLEYHRKSGMIKENAHKALDYFNKAIEVDSNYSRAYAWKACSLANVINWNDMIYTEDEEKEFRSALNKSLELNPDDPEANRIMGSLKLEMDNDHDLARFHIEKAKLMCPSDVHILHKYISVLIFHSDYNMALNEIEAAKRLDPFIHDILFEDEALCYMWLEDYDKAISCMDKLKLDTANSLYYKSIIYYKSNNLKLSKKYFIKCKTNFKMSIDRFIKYQYYKDEKRKVELKKILNKIHNI
tara:strand:+ start:219 stop:1958 length:1740 start_codon:yes stop_codon:yes gene_type:complete